MSSVISFVFRTASFVFKFEETERSGTTDVPIFRLMITCHQASIYRLGEISSEKIALFFLNSNYLRKCLPAPQRCGVFRGGLLNRETGDTVEEQCSSMSNTSSSSSSSSSALSSCLSHVLSPSAWWNLINCDREELSVHHSGNLFFVPDKDISHDTSP